MPIHQSQAYSRVSYKFKPPYGGYSGKRVKIKIFNLH